MESISEDYGGCGVSPVSARATGGEESCAMLIKRECKDGEGVDSYSGSQQGLTNGACAGKKSRPIPPPLDLTVRNLDQSHEDVVHPLTSPKSPTQKHLPLRKRALSWSNLGEAPNSGGTFVSTSLDLPYGTGSSSVFERGSHCDNPEACSVPRYSNNLENVDSIPKPATPALKSTPPLKFSIASLGLEGLLTPASSSSSSQPSSVASSAEALDGHPLSPAKRSSRCYISSASASLSLPLDLTTSPYPYSPLVPTPVWGCFLHGTKIRFGSGEDGPWLSAEDLGRRMKDEPLTPAGSPSSDPGRSPLYVHKVERVTNGSDLTFAIVHFKVSENGPVSVFSAACAIDHPFFVKDGGWSAVFPDMMTGNYGLPGRELLIGDMVVQPSLAAPSPLPKSSGVLSGQPPECHTSLTPDLETRLKVFTFPPPPHMRVSEAMPTSPFLMTGSHCRMPTPHSPYPMHAPHRSVGNDRAGSSGVQSPGYQLPHFGAFSSPPGSASSSASASSSLLSPMPFSAGMSSPNDLLMLSPPESPGMRRGIPGIPAEIDRTRRPMNGFMLFAKQFRQEMIQANPGKDNRSISILLGDAWKRLSSAQREGYSMCARQMAEEYKRAHPDCWKRKRTKVKQPKSVGQ